MVSTVPLRKSENSHILHVIKYFTFLNQDFMTDLNLRLHFTYYTGVKIAPPNIQSWSAASIPATS